MGSDRKTEIFVVFLTLTVYSTSKTLAKNRQILPRAENEVVPERTDKDDLEYISVVSLVVPLTVYALFLVAIPPCVILTVFLLEKLDAIKSPEAAATHRSLSSDSDCYRRISCEAKRFLSSAMNKYDGEAKSSVSCDKYNCKWLKKSPELARQENPNENEFNFLEMFPMIEGIFGSLGEALDQLGLTYFVTHYGLWPPYIYSIIILSFPVTIFCVSLVLVSLVVSPDDEEEERRRIIRPPKKNIHKGRTIQTQKQSSELDANCTGVFCAIQKYVNKFG